MKTRIEYSGLHFFNRVSGIHILMNEYSFPDNLVSPAPRTLSLAITNRCNLNCHYCYAPKNSYSLPAEFIKSIATKFDKLGTLELSIGGGEPFLYPGLVDLILWLWGNTGLGINITTNGLLINEKIVSKIAGNVSSIRFSIDGLEPKYSIVKRNSLSNVVYNIKLLKNIIPFGINIIVNPYAIVDVENIIKLGIEIGAFDVLLIPEHKNGIFQLNSQDWKNLEGMVTKYLNKIQINITYDASNYLSTNYLETEVKKEFSFIHISADRKIKKHSYDKHGIYIENIFDIENYLKYFNHN